MNKFKPGDFVQELGHPFVVWRVVGPGREWPSLYEIEFYGASKPLTFSNTGYFSYRNHETDGYDMKMANEFLVLAVAAREQEI